MPNTTEHTNTPTLSFYKELPSPKSDSYFEDPSSLETFSLQKEKFWKLLWKKIRFTEFLHQISTRRSWQPQNLFQNCSCLVGQRDLRGNQPGAQELQQVKTQVWAVTVLAPFFYTNTTTISSQNHTDRFQRAFAGLVFSWIVSLCPRKNQQNKDQWIQAALRHCQVSPHPR